MKRQLLNRMTALSILCMSAAAVAQTVPNNSFENWTMSATFEHPVVAPSPVFNSSNFDNFYQNGILNCTEVTGVSGSAMRVENILYGGDTLRGFASWGDGNGGSFSGGIPMPAAMPLTGCNVSVRYSINAATPGFIAFIPMTAGTPSGAGNGLFPGAYVFQLSGTQSTFTNLNCNFAPALTSVPDSVIVFVSSADEVVTSLGTPGDYLEVDNFAWTGTTDVFPGGNLDIWQPIPAFEVPQVWNVDIHRAGTETFAKSTDASNGMFSLQLMNNDDGGSGTYIRTGRATLGSWNCPSGGGPCVMRPGMQLLSTPKSFGFYYKYSTPGVDTASAYVNLLAAGVGVTGNWLALLPASGWTFRSIILPTPGTAPDSAFISFESGRWMTAVNNSTLLVDDMKFHYCNETASINGPTSVCVGSNGVVFSINSEFATGYSWSTTTGTIPGSTTNQSVMIDNIMTGGTVTVIKTYGDGCPPKTFNLPITTTAVASANAGSSQNVCSNLNVAVSGTVTGATGGNWTTSGGGSFSSPGSLMTTYMPTPGDISAGSVTLTLTPTGTGTCPSTPGTMTVTFLPVPTVGAGTDITNCYGSNVTLYGSGASTYTWDMGVTDGVGFMSPVGTTVYTVTGAAANGCTDTDQISVTTNPLPSVSFTLSAAVDTVCDNASAFTLSGGLPSGGTYSGTGVSGGMFNPVTAGVGTYTLTYTFTDVNMCAGMATANIVVKSCTSTDIAEQSLLNRIYPNPATDALFIELNNGGQEYQVSISDVSGRVIMNDASGKDVYKADMSSLAKGVYFVKITAGETVINKRIVKE